MRSLFTGTTALILVLSSLPAAGQFRLPRIPGIDRANAAAADAADKIGSIVITQDEEAQIGAQISAGLRQQYGVVQDADIHRYVGLVGSLLAAESTRPNLPWTFIVLDTPGVNAFAAPGGYVHITRGAMALMASEAALAGALAHEIVHVTSKHALKEISKAQGAKIAAAQTRSEALAMIAETGFALVKGNLWGKPDELEADRIGVALSNKAGYAPTGLGTFLTTLMERNAALVDVKEKDRAKGRNGLFSTHPEMQERAATLTKLIASQKLTATATVASRYLDHVRYEDVSVAELQAQMAAAAPEQPAAAAAPAPGAIRALNRGLDAVSSPTAILSNRQDAGVAYARNLDVEQFAPGGPDPNPVAIVLTPEEIAQFKAGVI